MRAFFLLGLPVLALTPLACSPTEAQIRDEIALANHCEVDSDCASAGSVCPFGCYILVHKDEVARIQELVEGFASNCVYDCVAASGFACNADKTCEIVPATP